MAKMEELIAPGHKSCAGCGCIACLRMMMRALGRNTIVAESTGCMEVTTTLYPQTSWRVPWVHNCFENSGAVASGIEAALKSAGKLEGTNVVALGGDGAMSDIGFRSISGAMERGHDMIIIMYDNEAYMNTGVQRSSSTPLMATTTTSPSGKFSKGKGQMKKDMAGIAVAHGLKYVATSSVAYPMDIKNKIEKAKKIRGPKFLHIHAPCPVGWGFDSAKSIEVARLAVETGMWTILEYENGKLRINMKPELKPVKEYLSLQKRFRHLKDEDVAKIQEIVKKHREYMLEVEKCSVKRPDYI